MSNPRVFLVFTLCSVGFLLAMISFAATNEGPYPRSGITKRVNLASNGAEANSESYDSAISADGQHVAFRSNASNLVLADTNGTYDMFVHDRATGATERVSLASDGAEADSSSSIPAISADGRHVAFESKASNLVPADGNGVQDVFVHDRATGVTARVSVASDGVEANAYSYTPSIGTDGRHVAFVSYASNLVPADTNETWDVFVHDRTTGVTERVSLGSEGAQANADSYDPVIGANGRDIAFWSYASNLIPADTNGTWDVFVHDRDTGTTERVSETSDGIEGNRSSKTPAISADGRYVAFTSSAFNLVPADTDGKAADMFVHDRATGVTERVSVASDGAEANSSCFTGAISADGRHVAFDSLASNLVPGDTNGTLDVFVHDRVTGATERVNLGSDGTEANAFSYTPAITADGRHVAFRSYASNLVPADTNGTWDVFVRDHGPALGVSRLAVLSSVPCMLDVSGSAAFAGKVITFAEDSPTDGSSGAQENGGELTGASLIYRPERQDLLALWQIDHLPTTNGTAGMPGVFYVLEITAGEARYQLVATAPGIFALNRCDVVCAPQAQLQGSIGTTREKVMVAIPLVVLGVSEGVALSNLRAYTVMGDPTGVPLDEVALAATIVPIHSVTLGIAAAGTPEAEVAFTAATTLNEGNFSGTISSGALASSGSVVWARACLGETCGGSVSVPGVITNCVSPVQLLGATSSKVHGNAGAFEIILPLTGLPGVECRSGGANADHTIIFTFANPLTSIGGATVTRGNGSVSSSAVNSNDTHQYIVNLTGVTNAQDITVTLTAVTDAAGNSSPAIAGSVGVLLGDTTGSGSVNSSDISQTKSQSGQAVSASNFRQDVTVNGSINSSDISLVKSNSGTALSQ